MAIKHRNSFVGLAELTSANGTTRNGATMPTNKIGAGGLTVQCISKITTTSVVGTFTPQVSMDGSVWYNWKQPQNPAQVTTAAGTGSEVVTRLALDIGPAVSSWVYFRCNALLSGAATAGADVTQVDYRHNVDF